MTKYRIANGYYPADRPSSAVPPDGRCPRICRTNEDGTYNWYWYMNPEGGYYADDADYIPDGAIAKIKDGKKMWYLDPFKENEE